MSSTINKVILHGAPFAWVHRISAGVITELWKFDNLQDCSYSLPKVGADSGGENLDIPRNDGLIWRFTKESRILEGISGDDITPADASSDATGKGSITLVINEAPIEMNSMSAFREDLKAKQSDLFLVTIATGVSYTAKMTNKKPEGYIHMVGKINNDLSETFNANHNTVTLEFVSYTNSGLEEDDLSTAVDLFTGIVWKLGGVGKDIANIKPPNITSQKEAEILAGELAMVTDITYS
ncbi:MAG: hypothetical protein KIT33_12590 [Candidatus Kapabacteria bacterium]|nr:hypothetical protein [Ignavibacteriota bacterium]MCW5885798.1 hypothetical protein [Candidatus Kapabacteria bacterium]